MASVQNETDCNQCGYEYAHYEVQTRTGSEYIFCLMCGYYSATKAIIDRQKSKDGRFYFKTNKDGSHIYRKKEIKGNGAYRIAYKSGAATFGSIEHEMTDDTVKYFKGLFENEKIDEGKSYLTRWNQDKKEAEVVLGKVDSLVKMQRE